MLTVPATENVLRSRRVERIERGQATSDGAGVKLTRLLSTSLHRRLDPFLMLDSFRSDQPDDWIGGFPDHPHRGFETITYMVAGRMRHRDSAGHEGVLEPGGAQWMTAGRGLIHSEMPEQSEGLMEGFQLWLNLPAADKLCAPTWRDFAAQELPQCLTAEGVRVVVIAGHSHGIEGAMQRPVTEPVLLDVHLPAGARFAQALPLGHNAFVQVYRGAVHLAGTRVEAGPLVVCSTAPDQDGLVLEAGDGPARVLVGAGRPLREPIVQYGPFVMNSTDQIRQAVADYQAGRMA